MIGMQMGSVCSIKWRIKCLQFSVVKFRRDTSVKRLIRKWVDNIKINLRE